MAFDPFALMDEQPESSSLEPPLGAPTNFGTVKNYP